MWGKCVLALLQKTCFMLMRLSYVVSEVPLAEVNLIQLCLYRISAAHR